MKERRLAILVLGAMAACSASRLRPDGPSSSSAREDARIELPGDAFMMGSREGEADERPPHRVQVAGFAIDVHEVTVAAYAACVRAGRCTPAATSIDWPGVTEDDRREWDRFCNGDRADRQQHPVNCVGWGQAVAFCAFAGGRLPTEEEWELAARGTEGRTWPWGNEPPSAERMNGCGAECVAAFPQWKPTYAGDDGWVATAPVKSYPAGRTPTGLYDLAGNVWEWTASRASADYSKERTAPERIDRGGSWHQDRAADLRAAKRDATSPAVRGPILGFRCAR